MRALKILLFAFFVRCDSMTTMQEVRNKIKVFKPASQEIKVFDPAINEHSIRLYTFKDNTDTKFKIWVFTDRIQLETPLATSLLFSINFPDQVCLANKLLDEFGGIGKIFTDNSNDDQIQFCISLLEDDLKSLNFTGSEGLKVYRNSLQLTLQQDRQLLPEIEACKKVKSLIELNFPDEVNDIDFPDLPTDLRQILIKFRTWAISDDLERDEKILELKKKQRVDLIEAIEPKLEAINSFLETFGDKPLTEGAISLQSLAELVIELKHDR